MNKKKVMIFSLFVVTLLFISGCQEYLNKDAVGFAGDIDCTQPQYRSTPPCVVEASVDDSNIDFFGNAFSAQDRVLATLDLEQARMDALAEKGQLPYTPQRDDRKLTKEDIQEINVLLGLPADATGKDREELFARLQEEQDTREALREEVDNRLAGGDDRALVEAMRAAGVISDPTKKMQDAITWVKIKGLLKAEIFNEIIEKRIKFYHAGKGVFLDIRGNAYVIKNNALVLIGSDEDSFSEATILRGDYEVLFNQLQAFNIKESQSQRTTKGNSDYWYVLRAFSGEDYDEKTVKRDEEGYIIGGDKIKIDYIWEYRFFKEGGFIERHNTLTVNREGKVPLVFSYIILSGLESLRGSSSIEGVQYPKGMNQEQITELLFGSFLDAARAAPKGKADLEERGTGGGY